MPKKLNNIQNILEELPAEPLVCSELIDELLDSVMIHDADNNIVYANRFAYESRGYSSSEILKMKISDLVDSSNKKKMRDHVEQSYKHGGFLFETVHVRKDKSKFPVEVWIKPIIFEGEKCLIGVSRDITKRKSLEMEALRENAKTRLYLNLVPVIVVELDCFGTVTMINEHGAELLGYPEEVIVGKNWFDNFVPKAERAAVKDVFSKIASGEIGTFEHFESDITTKNSDIKSIAWKNNFVKDSGGRIATVLSSGMDVTEIRHIQTQIESSHNRLERVVDGIVGALAKTVETKDPYTAGHQARVAILAVEIAKEMGMDPAEIRTIRLAATIHDIGKIYVPAEILNKPGALSKIEFEMIKLHSQTGYDVLKDIDFVGPVAQMVLQHHERMDGSGYPNGENGKAIITGSRILAVSDVVEAMSSHRPYRPGLGIAPALEEISAKRGVAFDSNTVDACLGLFNSKRFAFPN